MKVTTIKTLTFVLLVAAAFSCKKSNDSAPSKSKTEYLTSSAWKIQDAAMDANTNGSIDAGESVKDAFLDDCFLDNTITFKTDNTSTVDEGGTKCDAGDPQTASYAWHFENSEANITTTDPLINALSNGSAKVLQLDDTNMKLSVNSTLFGTPVVYLLLLKH
jgi:hypothetical protein